MIYAVAAVEKNIRSVVEEIRKDKVGWKIYPFLAIIYVYLYSDNVKKYLVGGFFNGRKW